VASGGSVTVKEYRLPEVIVATEVTLYTPPLIMMGAPEEVCWVAEEYLYVVDAPEGITEEIVSVLAVDNRAAILAAVCA
jgi:hypothetical protein